MFQRTLIILILKSNLLLKFCKLLTSHSFDLNLKKKYYYYHYFVNYLNYSNLFNKHLSAHFQVV